MRVLNDQILVRRSKGEEFSSILATPDVAKQKAAVGTVLRAGQGRVVQQWAPDLKYPGQLRSVTRREPLACRPGDRVVFTDWGGEAWEVKERDREGLDADLLEALEAGDELFIISEDYVLAVVQGEGKVVVV